MRWKNHFGVILRCQGHWGLEMVGLGTKKRQLMEGGLGFGCGDRWGDRWARVDSNRSGVDVNEGLFERDRSESNSRRIKGD